MSNTQSSGSQLILFVNGYTKGPKLFGLNCKPGRLYWGEMLIKEALDYFPNSFIDEQQSFINGEGSLISSGKRRQKAGAAYARKQVPEIKKRLPEGAGISIISHSMGGAFAEGMIEVLAQHNLPVNKVLHLSPADPRQIRLIDAANVQRIQLNVSGDRTLKIKDLFSYNEAIPGIKNYGLVDWSLERYHAKWLNDQKKKNASQRWDAHYDTKTYSTVIEWIRDLEQSELVKTQHIRSENTSEWARVYYHNHEKLPAKTRFKSIIQNGIHYHREGIYNPHSDKYLGPNE